MRKQSSSYLPGEFRCLHRCAGGCGRVGEEPVLQHFANWGLAVKWQCRSRLRFRSSTNANFSSSTFVTFLATALLAPFANTLATTSTFMCNLAGKNAFPASVARNLQLSM